jgi:hypothetical protein
MVTLLDSITSRYRSQKAPRSRAKNATLSLLVTISVIEVLRSCKLIWNGASKGCIAVN